MSKEKRKNSDGTESSNQPLFNTIISALAVILAGALGGVVVNNIINNNFGAITAGTPDVPVEDVIVTQTPVRPPEIVVEPTSSPDDPVIIITATPTPITTMLYEEDFEDGQADGLRSEDYHRWEVIEEDSGNHSYLGREGFVLQLGEETWDNYAFELRFKPLTFTFLEVGFRNVGAGNENQHYLVGIDAIVGISIQRATNSIEWDSLYASNSTAITNASDWNNLRVEVNDELIMVYFNGIRLPDVHDFELDNGNIMHAVHAGATFLIDDIRVRSLDN